MRTTRTGTRRHLIGSYSGRSSLGCSREVSPSNQVVSAEDLSLRIAGTILEGCRVCMRRLKFHHNKRGVYWWNDEVAQVRKRCVAVRRLLTRKRRRGVNSDDLKTLYRKARSDLCKHIKKAKLEAWTKLIETLDKDPWGLPYKIVIDRLRRSGSSLSESLEPEVVERLLDNLFLSDEVHNPEEVWSGRQIDVSTCEVSIDEVTAAIRGRRRGGCPAPGPDGISLDIWKRVPRIVLELLAALYSLCLKEGKIPGSRKRATLILIPKGNIDVTNPKARPICLLDDVGKFFERIIATRLKAHMSTFHRPHTFSRLVSGTQFGFREGLSTTDALDAVTNHIREKIEEGRVVIAVSLDIKNAFNSLSWRAIRWALERRGYPEYLRRVLDYYLSDWCVEYPICTGELRSRRVVRGVPQGSVLGPLLWSIAYEYVLRIEYQRRPGCVVVGYVLMIHLFCAPLARWRLRSITLTSSWITC